MSKKANLVLQTAFLGDLILSVPTLKRIKKLYPEDDLIVVCKKGLGDFLIQEKIVDTCYEVEKSNSESYNSILTQLKQVQIRQVFCLHKSLRSLFFVRQLRAEMKIGFSSLVGFFIFDKTVSFIKKNPEVIRQIKILEPVDSELRHQLAQKDFGFLNKADKRGYLPEVPDFFSFEKKISSNSAATIKVAIFPGSVWATKQWTQWGFTELAQRLLDQGYHVDLMGGPTEKNLCESIARTLTGAVSIKAGSLSIAESIKSLAQYNLVISNDSASTHMAAYNQVPVLTIFGPTLVEFGFRPWTNKSVVVENKKVSCRPCSQHGPQKCPLEHHRCMTSISSTDVFLAAQKILALS